MYFLFFWFEDFLLHIFDLNIKENFEYKVLAKVF